MFGARGKREPTCPHSAQAKRLRFSSPEAAAWARSADADTSERITIGMCASRSQIVTRRRQSPRVGEKGAPGRVVVRAEVRVRGAPREEVLVSGVGGERGEEDVVVGEEGE